MPDVITRITEFVPEVVEYIEKIIKNGFAYESKGSVYFDVKAFKDSGKEYPRLRVMTEKSEQIEVDLESNEFKDDKKDPRDFVLWKASKEGEPYWDSPWGNGRPGWHIECSVMCSNLLKTPVDLHTGGEDLKFPHHDNEIA